MSDMFEKVARMAGKVVQMDEKRAQGEADRDGYAIAVHGFRESGWWSEAELAEYAKDAGRMMKTGTADEKRAASDFYASKLAEKKETERKVSESVQGINERIRASIAQGKEDMKRAA